MAVRAGLADVCTGPQECSPYEKCSYSPDSSSYDNRPGRFTKLFSYPWYGKQCSHVGIDISELCVRERRIFSFKQYYCWRHIATIVCVGEGFQGVQQAE